MEIQVGGYYSYQYSQGGIHSGNCTIVAVNDKYVTFKPDYAKEATKGISKVTFGEPK